LGVDSRAYIEGSAAEAITVPASLRKLDLDLIPERFAVVRLDPGAGVPDWADSSRFLSVTRTPGELSIVCHESVLPPSVQAQRGFRCLAVRGPLSLSETGILESLTGPLATAGVSIFALSTYETDYLFVPCETLEHASHALSEAGHAVHGWGAA
jgi:hypothetical protein